MTFYLFPIILIEKFIENICNDINIKGRKYRIHLTKSINNHEINNRKNAKCINDKWQLFYAAKK